MALAICCLLHLDLPLDLLKGMGFRIKPAVCGERPARGNAFGSRVETFEGKGMFLISDAA